MYKLDYVWEKVNMSKVKIGLALGGGGARGFCHVGVLKILEEHNIKPYAIAGTSMGAVVGGIHASGADINEVAKFADELSMIKIADLNFFSMYRHSLLKGEKVKKIISKMICVKKVEECPIKFTSVSFDLNSGKEVQIKKGDLCDAIYASMAVPALFRPLEKDGMRLVDGGVADNLPHKLLKKMGCNLIICVDATGNYDGHKYKRNAVSMLTNILNVVMRQQQKLLEDKENITITPKLDGILNFSFNKDSAAKSMKAGEIEAKKYISKIKKRIKQIEESENV